MDTDAALDLDCTWQFNVFRRGYLRRCSMSMSFANYRQEKANVWFRVLVGSGFLALAA